MWLAKKNKNILKRENDDKLRNYYKLKMFPGNSKYNEDFMCSTIHYQFVYGYPEYVFNA